MHLANELIWWRERRLCMSMCLSEPLWLMFLSGMVYRNGLMI